MLKRFVRSLPRKKILICGFDLKQRLRLINSLRDSFEIMTESSGRDGIRILRKEDVDCVVVIINKRRFQDQMRLIREIKTEEKNPPLILIVDSYCCLPKPHNFIKQEDIGGYIGGRDTSIDFLQVMNQVFCGQNPVIIGKTSLRDKIWKRIRS